MKKAQRQQGNEVLSGLALSGAEGSKDLVKALSEVQALILSQLYTIIINQIINFLDEVYKL